LLTPLILVPLRAAGAEKPSFEQYLRESAVPRATIDRFLKGPAWAQYDPELGYILSNYLPADGMDKSATISTVQTNGARTSFVYAEAALVNRQLALAASEKHIWAGWRNIGKGAFADYGRLLAEEKFAAIASLTREL
jgi:hypothetical protein